MPILVVDGGYAFSPTNGTNQRFRDRNGWSFLLDIHICTLVDRTRDISFVVRTSMVANRPHKTKVAKEHH